MATRTLAWLVALCLMSGCEQAPREPIFTASAAQQVAAVAPAPQNPLPKLPNDALSLMPVLRSEIGAFWPGLGLHAFPAGIVEQESLWKIRAKLQTSREYGCGLGQFTKAYDKNGKVRFDALTETKRLDPSLADWNWEDCYNAQFQLRGLVLKLKINDRSCAAQLVALREVLACDAAMYNGGAGSVSKRIRLCDIKPGCDPTKWFGHLEYMVAQSTVKVRGYGESFAETNSKYPGRVFARMDKYEGYLK